VAQLSCPIEGGFAGDRLRWRSRARRGTAKAGESHMCLGTSFFSDTDSHGQPARLHAIDDPSAMKSVARRRRPARGHAPVFALPNDLPLSNIEDGVIFARLQVTQPLTQKALRLGPGRFTPSRRAFVLR